MPDRLYFYTWNAVFGAIFGTERCCSVPLMKVVLSISDGFSGHIEPLIAFNMESREVLCVIIVELLQTIFGYVVQSQWLIVFFNKLASWRRSALFQVQISSRWIILCLSRSAVYIIPDNFLQQYRTVLFTLYRRAFCTSTKTFPVCSKRSLRSCRRKTSDELSYKSVFVWMMP